MNSNLFFKIRDQFIINKRLSRLKVFISKIFNMFGVDLVVYNQQEARKITKLINKYKNDGKMLLHFSEAYQIFKAVESTQKIPGDIAEVGVYRGGSAKIICQAKGSKILHLFDTFEGFPYEEKGITLGEIKADIDTVKKFINNKEVNFYKGVFPSTSEPVKDKKFSFVHLDVDLYKSTLDCLEFFYPRMSKGGIIISHDYYFPSIRRAFSTFFKDKPETIIDLNIRQCLVSKI